MSVSYLLYNAATLAAAPVGAAYLALRRKYRPLLRRFRPLEAPLPDRPLWLQACSVGEVNAVKTVLAAIRERWRELPILLTTSTVSGYQLAQDAGFPATVAYFPFDDPFSVRRFLDRARPQALVLMETEIWPNVLRLTRQENTPVMLINGRISDNHFPAYRRYRRWLRPVFARISLAAVQNEEYATRFRELGVAPDAIHVTGNTKIDGVRMDGAEELRRKVLEEHDFPADAPILVFGSTRPGDEALAAACWRLLKAEFEDLYLIVAPRHRDRLAEAIAPFDEPVLLRSAVKEGRRRNDERVLFVDTVGELVSFYAAATVAVVGGSFYPGVDGHNPLEPAAFGVPTVFGPYMRNLIDPARVLVAAEGAVQVPEPDALLDVLLRLLRNPEERRRIGDNGREAILKNRGAIDRSLDLLATLLPGLQ